jgi:hypothetical protein
VTRRLLTATFVPLAIGTVAAIPLVAMIGPNQAVFAAIAFGPCVVPGLVVVLLHDYLIRTSPFGRIVALALGTVIRLALGFGGGTAVFFLLMDVRERNDKIAYFAWLLFAYLTTLIVETVLFAKPVEGSRLASQRVR